MFTVWCDAEQARVLLGNSAITGIRSTPEGIVTSFRCRCGAEGVFVEGRLATRRDEVHDVRALAAA